MTSRGRSGQAGQAGVEWVGTVVAVALLCAALALWSVRALGPIEGPPDAVGHLVAPLGASPGSAAAPAGVAPGGHGGPAAARAAAGAPRTGAPLMGRPAQTIAQIARRAGGRRGAGAGALAWLERRTRTALAVGREAGAAFGVAFADRMRARLQGILDDPGAIDLTPSPAELRGIAVAQDLIRHMARDPRALAEYLRRLRAMPPRRAAAVLGHDAGTLAADGVAEAAELIVKRLLLRGVVRASRRERGSVPG